MTWFNRLKTGLVRIKKWSEKSRLLHDSFEVGIFLKGLNGVLEIIVGILLIFINPARLNQIIIFLTQNELVEDPKDFIANFIINLTRGYSVSSQHFGEFYLLSHGIIKVLLVWLLWRKKLWAYPLTIVVLILFILYQIYRYTYSHSFWLALLTIFDILIILLAWNEYVRIKMVFENNKGNN